MPVDVVIMSKSQGGTGCVVDHDGRTGAVTSVGEVYVGDAQSFGDDGRADGSHGCGGLRLLDRLYLYV